MENKKILGLLGLATKAGKVVFGTDSCMEAINKRKVKLIIVATDSAQRTKTNFELICKNKNVELIRVLTIEEISKSIGKENKAVVGIKDVNFSKEITKIINGGDIIG
ncbi:MAG: ribosomal L7Ae/L30e/S12e/Gadd45 family protein [Clostridia bacterium]|nr:ribosomal L7Ae/L30e/S12e/Gadd45 family protein [Clostridia bacterium]